MKLRCILIDDEPDALDALRIMILDFLGTKAEVVGMGSSVKAGKELITDLNPDVVFMDVEMPDGGGFEVANAFPDRTFTLVFVTAYDQYAIRALKIKAEDYLLKPVDQDELENLISQLWTKKNKINTSLKIKIPTKRLQLLVDPSEILYIKGDGRYSEIYLKNSKNYVITRNIGLFEHDLDSCHFFRVHKSYLVNLNHISSFSDNNVILSNGFQVEISRRKRKELKSRFDLLPRP